MKEGKEGEGTTGPNCPPGFRSALPRKSSSGLKKEEVDKGTQGGESFEGQDARDAQGEIAPGQERLSISGKIRSKCVEYLADGSSKTGGKRKIEGGNTCLEAFPSQRES